jgi:hypothetical protein
MSGVHRVWAWCLFRATSLDNQFSSYRHEMGILERKSLQLGRGRHLMALPHGLECRDWPSRPFALFLGNFIYPPIRRFANEGGNPEAQSVEQIRAYSSDPAIGRKRGVGVRWGLWMAIFPQPGYRNPRSRQCGNISPGRQRLGPNLSH